MPSILDQPKVFFGVAAFFFDIMLCIFTMINYYEGSQSRKFRYLVFTITIATVCEIARSMSELFPYTLFNNYIRRFLQHICFVFGGGMAFVYTVYLNSFLKSTSKRRRIMAKVNALIYVVFCIILLISIHTGWVGSYDEANKIWIRGPLYLPVGYGVSAYFMLYAIAVFSSHRSDYPLRVLVTMYFSIGTVVLSMVIQPFLNGRTTITTYGASLSLFLWYFAVENSDYRNLVDVTKELDEARKKALEANQAKSAFLANMSHEIRTPMNAVLGLDEMILNTDDKAEIDEYARNIKNSGKSLLSIINDILDFSKIESGKMELVESAYHFAELLNDVNLQISMKASKNGLSYQTDIDQSIPDNLFGDDVRLRQIITNILNNAVKYTKEGSVSLMVRGFREGDKINLQFVISDTGMGIRKENIPNIFGSFERLEQKSTKSIEGTGLGLAIVSRLLKLMGGTVDVQSEFGHGSTFTVTVPQKVVGESTLAEYKVEEEPLIEEKSLVKNFQAPEARVLVVDDNNVNLLVAEGFLKKTGAKITSCDSGMKALEYMRKNCYDIIFLDHMMPGMDGIETLSRARSQVDGLNRFTPVVALTANAISGMKEMYLKAGFTDYVSKPIDSTRFYEVFFHTIPQNLIVQKKNATTPAGPEASKNLRKKMHDENSVPSKNKVIDFESGVALCGGDRGLYGQLLQVFCSEKDENQVKLMKYLMEGDWKNYRILVHALKSNAKMLGADDFSDLARKLEFACRDIIEGNSPSENVAFVEANHEPFVRLYTLVVEQGALWNF
ncbi:MAG TPA: hypothetical protein DCM57_06780 [Treponema sp.]|nr:hypothetical protein [Treponema sp.]